MNKFAKSALRVAAVLLPVGIVLIIIGLIFGARDMVYNNSLFSLSIGKSGLSFGNDAITEIDEDVDAFTSIDIDVTNAYVQLLPSKDDKYHVDLCLFAEKEDLTMEVENGVLTIKDRNSNGFVNWIFEMINMFGDDDDHDMHVMVYVPGYEESMLDDVKIDVSNGTINIKDIKVSGNADVETSNGSIEIDDFTCKELILKTSNGSIDIDNMFTKGESSIKTSNGKIYIDEYSFYGETSVKTSNGKISATNLSINSDENLEIGITAKTSNGEVEVNEDEKDDDYEKSGSGDESTIHFKTNNGDINIEY